MQHNNKCNALNIWLYIGTMRHSFKLLKSLFIFPWQPAKPTLAPFFTRAREKVAKIIACFSFNKSINQMSATCVINELIIMEQRQKHIRCRSLMRELVFLKTLTNLNRISWGVTEAASLSLLFTSVLSEETRSARRTSSPNFSPRRMAPAFN